jgi:hypothetical protein
MRLLDARKESGAASYGTARKSCGEEMDGEKKYPPPVIVTNVRFVCTVWEAPVDVASSTSRIGVPG